MQHTNLPDAGRTPHHEIDGQLPSMDEKELLRVLAANAPAAVTGARNNPEQALANLLTVLATLGLITNSTTAS